MNLGRRVTLLLAVTLVLGCQSRPTRPDSSFFSWFKKKPTASAGGSGRYTSPGGLADTDAKSPLERDDPFLDRSANSRERNAVDGDDPLAIASADRTAQDDPIRRQTPDIRLAPDDKSDRADKKVGAVTASERDFDKIRERLDRMSAKYRYEKVAGTGENHFYCEIPHPNNPDMLRVFEATHADELKAMVAVTEAAEKWFDNEKRAGKR